jgi:glycosyltransferase involved in cell wall biosynthesis
MKIAMIGQKGIPARLGGVERHVEELAVRLAARGDEVLVYCRPRYVLKPRKKLGKVQLVTLPSIRTKHADAASHTILASLHALWRGADIFHYHGVGPALFSWIPRVFSPRAKVVVTFHCIDRHHAKWGRIARLALFLGERAACRFAHTTIAVSDVIRRYCKKAHGRDAVLIPNGGSAQKGLPSSTLGTFGLVPNRYIVMVSRLVAHKGAHTLIEAWKSLRDRRGCKLAIVGAGSFTDEYVKALHESARGDESIVFTGPQEGARLATLFRDAAFVVHPSFIEGMPLVLLEAGAYGKAVLASDIPEHREVLDEHGFYFEAGASDALARMLGTLIDHPQRRNARAGALQARIRSRYNWDDIVKRTATVYDELSTEEKRLAVAKAH